MSGNETAHSPNPEHQAQRRILVIVAALNLAYFAVEMIVAWRIGSVSLFADAIDFLEDGLVNLLILYALGFGLLARARLGLGLSALMALPALAALWAVWRSITTGVPPEPIALTVTGAGALAVNFCAALILARVRVTSSLMRVAFLSARNDVIANAAIIVTGLVTAATGSIWPDIVVGLGIAMLHADGAREVYQAAIGELADAGAHGDPRA